MVRAIAERDDRVAILSTPTFSLSVDVVYDTDLDPDFGDVVHFSTLRNQPAGNGLLIKDDEP